MSNLEVHEHSYISGPNAHWTPCRRIEHSHADGSTGHKHADLGPATFTIAAAEWAARTDMKGGGKKAYTRKPSGPQLEWVDLEPWQKTLRVIFTDSMQTIRNPRVEAEGVDPLGDAVALRMILQFDMEAVYEDHRGGGPR